MNNLPQKSFRIVRVRPYSCEEGCIVYVDTPDGILNAAEPGDPEDLRSGLDSCWEEILDYCQEFRGCIHPVLVLSADGRRLLRVSGLKGELFLPEGVEEVAGYAATDEDDNEISRIVWNGSIRRIGKEAFLGAVTYAAVLPPTVESIGDSPFRGDYIVSCQCHFGDAVDKNHLAPSSVRRYKNYRRFLDDMVWIGHVCTGYGSVHEFARDVRGLLENFDGDEKILDQVKEQSEVMTFLSSYWVLRQLKEVDGKLLEVLCTRGAHTDEEIEVDGEVTKFSLREKYFMLILEDDTTPRKHKVEIARKIMTDRCKGLESTFPLYPLHFFHEDGGYWYPGVGGDLCCDRRVRDNELLDAINKDAASRFMMLIDVRGISVKKTIMTALFEAKAASCIAAAYAHYPKTDQKIPLNDVVLTALLYWPFAGTMSLIDAVEREMPGRISKVKDALGNNALWYLMMNQLGPCYLPDGRYRFGVGSENAAKRLVKLGVDPFETTPTGLSWYEIAIGEDDTRNMVVMNPRIAFLSMLKKRMMDRSESQDVS